MLKTHIADGQSRASENPERASFQLGDRRYSSAGPGEVEKEIRVRHPSPPPRGQSSSEGQVGWRDGDIGFICLEGTSKVEDEYKDYSTDFLYDRVGLLVLGERDETETSKYFVRRCFNCGGPDHAVADCPTPANAQLISLTRAMYMFFRPSPLLGEGERLHTKEEWKNTRLRWVDELTPGVIKGELLREALGLTNTDTSVHLPWLFEMLRWGYPPGWVADTDPREEMKRRLMGDPNWDDDDLLVVFDDNQGDSMPHLSSTTSHPAPAPEETDTERTRYARYTTDLFSSLLLPVYNGIMLPPIGEEQPKIPPWRIPGALGHIAAPSLSHPYPQSAVAYSQYYYPFYYNPMSLIQPPPPVIMPANNISSRDSDDDMDLSE